jgi:hypothetical protein
MVQKIDLKHMPTKSRAWIEAECLKLARGCLGGSEIHYVGEPPATNPRRGITLAGLFLAGAGARSRYGARMMPQCSQWLCWLGGLVRLGENIEWAEVKFCVRAVGSTPGEDGAPTRT